VKKLGIQLAHSPLHQLIVCAFVVLILAPLFQHGLFTDGYLYKGVAANYAKGEASFWQMKFTNINMPQFVEQPPFFFFVNGMWFKCFGMSHIADKLFSCMLLLMFFYFVFKLLGLFFKAHRFFFWIILFQLVLVQVWCWTYVNQVIETLVIPLSVMGTYLFFKWQKGIITYLNTFVYAVLFTSTCVLLFLTKGFQSVFIAAIPLLGWLLLKNKKQIFWFATLSYTLLVTVFVFLLVYLPNGKLWFDAYLQKRLMGSLNNVGATTDNHFEIIFRIFTELIGVLIVMLSISIVLIKKYKYSARLLFLNFAKNKLAILFLLVGIMGSFPFAITLEQRGFYLTPSFFFFILSFTLWFKPYWIVFVKLIEPVNQIKIVKGIGYLILLGAIIYVGYSPFIYKQQQTMLIDAEALGKVLKKGDTLSINDALWNHISLQSELYIRYNVSLECGTTHTYFLRDKEIMDSVPKDFQKMELRTLQFELYKK
jgi:hypothetical protein